MGRPAVELATARTMAAALSAVWLVVAARNLPLPAFGDLALLLSLGVTLSFIGDLGLPLVLMDTGARLPGTARAALALVLRRRLAAASAAGVVTSVAYLAVAGDARWTVPATFAVSMLATAVHTSASAALRAARTVRAESLNELVSRMAVLVVGGAWLASRGGLLAAVTVYAAVDVVSALALVAVCARRLPEAAEAVDQESFGLRATAPLAGGGLLANLYQRADVWLLALIAGPTSVAMYAATYRLLDGLLLLPGAVAALVVPRTAALPPRERAAAGRRSAVLATVVVLPLSALVAAFGGRVLELLFGDPFAGAAPVLAVLMASASAGAVVTVLSPLVGVGTRRTYAVVMGSALGLNLVLNLALVPHLGTIGAALATLISQAVLAVVLWRLSGRLGRDTPYDLVDVEVLVGDDASGEAGQMAGAVVVEGSAREQESGVRA